MSSSEIMEVKYKNGVASVLINEVSTTHHSPFTPLNQKYSFGCTSY